jgi:excisionase family DNA binding protein
MATDATLLTTEEVAALLDLSPWTIRQLCRAQELGCYRLGRGRKGVLRFSREHVNAYLQRKEERPRAA